MVRVAGGVPCHIFIFVSPTTCRAWLATRTSWQKRDEHTHAQQKLTSTHPVVLDPAPSLKV
ncbi:hypothetical protein BCV70DRAFT_95648 [Testicularia cyperi]|uniref:Uncharacterized protein n=1 Tax=Testicularia cyperi TaxID=1882483 RepID=A0A317XT08_9BASI|nr:hypothetical protein BCV70DRAFT_95648 [Testicularia cyperi]